MRPGKATEKIGNISPGAYSGTAHNRMPAHTLERAKPGAGNGGPVKMVEEKDPRKRALARRLNRGRAPGMIDK